jgi:hypothetical protein
MGPEHPCLVGLRLRAPAALALNVEQGCGSFGAFKRFHSVASARVHALVADSTPSEAFRPVPSLEAALDTLRNPGTLKYQNDGIFHK